MRRYTRNINYLFWLYLYVRLCAIFFYTWRFVQRTFEEIFVECFNSLVGKTTTRGSYAARPGTTFYWVDVNYVPLEFSQDL